ncbi:MAG: formylglycine-generating enzyme family protein [Thiohalomonadales bacterium]
MSWLQTTDDDKTFVAALAEQDLPLYKVLRVVALATHIEPLLLRNTRIDYAPQSDIELEATIWFYEDIIQSRNALGLVMYGGIARALVDHFEQQEKDAYTEAKAFVEDHTRHWKPRDRLEQRLRWYARENNQDEVKRGLQQLLYTLTQLSKPEQRREFTRWIGGALPQLTKADDAAPEEAHWLNHYVSAIFGSTGKQLSPTRDTTTTIPTWLTSHFPGGENNRIGLRLYQNGLQCLPADEADHVIDINLPLPTPVLLQTEPNGIKQWQGLWVGRQIPLDPPFNSVTLQMLNGERYRLKTSENTEKQSNSNADVNNILQLVYMPEDHEQASAISHWLTQQGYRIKLVEQSRQPVESPSLQTPVLHLWTKHTAHYWQDKSHEDKNSPPGILLRTETRAELPLGFRDSPTKVLDLPDWRGEEEFAGADHLLASVHALLHGQPLNTDVAAASVDMRNKSQGRVNNIDDLMAEIKDPATPPKRRLEIGDLLAEMGDTRAGVGLAEYSVEPQYPPEVKAWLDEIATVETAPPRRLEIGDQLAQWGDPRAGVGLNENGLPDIDWVEIPGGAFIYGEGKGKKQQTVELETFYMARYPVTNRQYQAFIDAGGYEDERWWLDLKKHKLKKSKWLQANRPRTDVDWYESIAFCCWLSAQLGYEIRLPTEQQWEKAARGPDGREYPWGNYLAGYANVNEKSQGGDYLKQTTAVGMYPHGTSPYGVEDMAGNVWEWCLNKLDTPEDTNIDQSDDGRVLRGGSWVYYPAYARADYRYRPIPDFRYNYIGFRLLSSLPYSDL